MSKAHLGFKIHCALSMFSTAPLPQFSGKKKLRVGKWSVFYPGQECPLQHLEAQEDGPIGIVWTFLVTGSFLLQWDNQFISQLDSLIIGRHFIELKPVFKELLLTGPCSVHSRWFPHPTFSFLWEALCVIYGLFILWDSVLGGFVHEWQDLPLTPSPKENCFKI